MKRIVKRIKGHLKKIRIIQKTYDQIMIYRRRYKIWSYVDKPGGGIKCDSTKNIDKTFYIIGYSDPERSGWTVFERVVLYNTAYALSKGWIPVVDMKNFRSQYQEDREFKKVNVWDRYYEQPCGYSLEEALESRNVILMDPSHLWFSKIRLLRAEWNHFEILQPLFTKYIRIKREMKEQFELEYHRLLADRGIGEHDCEQIRVLGVVARGTDYKFVHVRHAPIEELIAETIRVKKAYDCSLIFAATEDQSMFEILQQTFGSEMIYGSGVRIRDSGDQLIGTIKHGREKDAYLRGVEYLQTLYILSKCVCLVGNECGATIMADYRKEIPYEYKHIFH